MSPASHRIADSGTVEICLVQDGMSTLLQKPVSAGVAPQLKLPGTKLPLFDCNEGNNQKRLPEYFGMDHTVLLHLHDDIRMMLITRLPMSTLWLYLCTPAIASAPRKCLQIYA